MTASTAHPVADPPHAWWWRGRLLWFMALWTLLMAGVVGVRFAAPIEAPKPEVIIVSERRPPQTWPARFAEWSRWMQGPGGEVVPWILLAPYVLWFGSRVQLDRDRLRRSLPLHLVACALFVGGSVAFVSVRRSPALTVRTFEVRSYSSTATATARITNSLADIDALIVRLRPQLTSELLPQVETAIKQHSSRLPVALGVAMDFFAYAALVGLAHAVLFQRRYRERERWAVALEGHLSRARLHALQAQLQPHFLFNALNGIATLLRRDPRTAEEMLTSLSDMLRLALANSDRQEVTLREELAFVAHYVEIQQMRFGERLRVEQAVDDSALGAWVPTLLLQPLVENAIRHGLEPSSAPVTVRIAAQREGGRLIVRVEDDGAGLQTGGAIHGSGVGLANLRARLATLYGERQRLDLGPRPGGGAEVVIEIPFRLAESNANAA